MTLYGIDVSSNQPRNIVDMVDCDFAIVKATGNPQSLSWSYKNPYMPEMVNAALSKTGLAGVYHFTWGKSAEEEADLFLSYVEGYIGRVILVIDYEAQAVELGREWLRSFIKRIKDKAGVAPLVYASASVIKDQDLVSLCADEGCGIWSANYYLGYDRISGYDMSRCKMSIDESAIWQFTASGRLDGYSGDLDLDAFFGTADDWARFATSDGSMSNPDTGAADKDVDTLAREVIAGVWGNGSERKSRLTAAGYDYDAVQRRVNELCDGGGKSVAEIADEVIAGVWGNGSERKNRLAAAGYDYDDVQAAVNGLLGFDGYQTYTVKSGDTLSGIAAKYGTTYQHIADANGISNPDLIFAGQVLRI